MKLEKLQKTESSENMQRKQGIINIVGSVDCRRKKKKPKLVI